MKTMEQLESENEVLKDHNTFLSTKINAIENEINAVLERFDQACRDTLDPVD